MVYIQVLTVFLIITSTVIFYIKRSFNYWKKKKVPHTEPRIPFGSIENPLSRHYSSGVWFAKLYSDYKSRGWKHAGLYSNTKPIYMPLDPNLIKNIMQNDFQHFVDRGIYHNEKDDPISAHLFAIGGQKWRNLRTKLTPTFTSGKMKMMFDTLMECSEQMKEATDNYAMNKEAVDIKDILARFTTDIIGSCAFGLECNSFKHPDAEFRSHGKKIFQPVSKFKALFYSFVFINWNVARKLGVTLTPKDTREFFMNVIRDTVQYREKNNILRKDMLQIMMDLKDGNSEKVLSIEEIAAQAFVFFIAGFETSSTTMTFCLYELATHPDIQTKVREEVNQVLAKNGGKITYESLAEMKYMGQVIDETLRKYPPLPYLSRDCVQDYQVPDTDVIIDNGTRIIISALGLQRDPEYFPEPEKFDPERFSEENKKNIRPFTYVPFGEGPRICLGLRFGMMQTKVGLAVLLKDYEFTVNKQTTVPLKYDRYSFILSSEDGIWLDLKKIT